MVYNSTSSVLNAALWAPHFALPTVRSTLRAVEKGTYMVDQDIGEMFLNLMLSEEVISYCGVDVNTDKTEEGQ